MVLVFGLLIPQHVHVNARRVAPRLEKEILVMSQVLRIFQERNTRDIILWERHLLCNAICPLVNMQGSVPLMYIHGNVFLMKAVASGTVHQE